MIVDGYVRVSKVGRREGERFISPRVQHEQIEGWARLRGAHIGRVFEELDKSGTSTDRPLLEEAIRRVERGQSDGVVVAKLDRFGRSATHGLAGIERIRRAGGTFVSVADGFDLSTDSGRLALRIMLAVAEWFVDRVRSDWAVAQERAVERGLHIGFVPTGYRRREDGRLEPDPVLGPLVGELYRRRAAGEPIASLARWLNEQGARTARGGSCWRPSSVRSLFQNRAYLGEARRRPWVKEGAHEPLTDPATWQRAQRPIERRSGRRGPRPVLLRGLLRCAGCRRALAAWGRRESGSSSYLSYRCVCYFAGGRCPAPAAITDKTIEPYLEALFWQELERRQGAAGRRLAAAEAAVERREAELARYRDNERVASTLGEERFAAGLAVRARRLERVLLELASERRAASAPELPPAEDLRQRWPAMGLRERGSAIAEVIDCAFVRAGRGAVEERVHVCLRGRAPLELPAPRSPLAGDHRPFDGRSCPPGARLRTQRAWTRAHLRAELVAFLAGRDVWPPFWDFQAAGLALAYAQLAAHGGAHAWADEFGLAYETPRRRLGAWSEERVRAELADYLRGKEHWPSYRSFHREGRGELRRAIVRHGGPERWAADSGFELRPAQRGRREPWSEERIEAALRELTAGRTTWPARREFFAAAHGDLYEALRRRGSRDGWAKRLGLRLERGAADVRIRWSEESIARALRPLLRGRRSWPSMREFRAAGLGGLAQTIDRSWGGHAAWARRYGLPRQSELRSTGARASIDGN